MALPEPSWRVKTRPCPFYQRGNCIFSTRCNFLHTVTPKDSPDMTLVELTQPSNEPIISPIVTVESPRSVRSPTRSPRLSGLLFALKDVIGEDEEDLVEDVEDAGSSQGGLVTSVNGPNISTESDTLVDSFGGLAPVFEDSWTILDGDSGSASTPDQNVTTDDEDTVRVSHTLENDEDNNTQSTIPAIQGSPNTDKTSLNSNSTNFTSAPPTPVTPDLLSPVDLSNLPLASFVRPKNQGDSSIDSGYAETDSWISPCPLVLSPPHSPALTSISDLFHSPTRSPPLRVLSPKSSGFIARVSSPLGSTLSSPRDNPVEINNVPLDLSLELEHTAESGSFTQSEGEQTAHVPERPLCTESTRPASTVLTRARASPHQVLVDDECEEEPVNEQTFSPSAAAWDIAESQSTALFLGILQDDRSSAMLTGHSSSDEPSDPPHDDNNSLGNAEKLNITADDINAAHERFVSSPVHFLTSGSVDFVGDEVEQHSSLADASPGLDERAETIPSSPSPSDESSELESSSDFTDDNSLGSSFAAHREHLPDLTLVRDGEDTLQSLYDVYSAFPSPEQDIHVITADQQPESILKTPTSASFPCRRVFTPPVGRNRSGTIVADSPNSLPSPTTSLQSTFQGHSTGAISEPSKAKGKHRARSPKDEIDDVQEVKVSTKIPFGFRHSLALGRAQSSSLMANRMSKSRGSPSSGPPQSTRTSPPTDQQYAISDQFPSSPVTGGLKPLKLSTAMTSKSYASPSLSSCSLSSPSNSYHQHGVSMSPTSVSSDRSLSTYPLLSSAGSSLIPEHIRNVLMPSHIECSSSLPSDYSHHPSNLREPHSAPLRHPQPWNTSSGHAENDTDNHRRVSSTVSEPSFGYDEDDSDDDGHDPYDYTIRKSIPAVPHTAPVTRDSSSIRSSLYTIATPRPTLLFAIASDDVEQVRRVLKNGTAGPNDLVGPQSALTFTLTNDQLIHKLDIVKTLLAFGADPTELKNPELKPPPTSSGSDNDSEQADVSTSSPPGTLLDSMDSATSYYVTRAAAAHTRRMSALIYRSFFRPLTHISYELVGQDRALEQLFRVLSIHSQQLSVTPIVALLCGPSGHGKSLLARKFGSLLGVPTHTVNMTTLRSTHDLWKSYSMTPYEEPTTCTLAEFLIKNEGSRCVVVLDEIEKTEDEATLWSLLMPWELGRCSLEAGSRHIDVRNVIWLGTSNIGHDLVFEHQTSQKLPDQLMSRENYIELMSLLRPHISERLGASVLSRVTTVLPFVPFTLGEQKAIIAEALYTLAGGLVNTLSSQSVESLVSRALVDYLPSEGARSLYRAVSSQLVDTV